LLHHCSPELFFFGLCSPELWYKSIQPKAKQSTPLDDDPTKAHNTKILPSITKQHPGKFYGR